MSAPTTMQWIRQAGDRLYTGSGRLATLLARRAIDRATRIWQRARDWLGEGEGLGWLLRLAVLLGIAALLRKIITAVAGGLYAAVADGRAPWLMWGAAGAWTVAAYRCGRDGWQPQQPTAAEETPAEEPTDTEDDGEPEPTVEQPAGPPPVAPVALVAAVRDIGTPHAQLVPLAQHLGTTTDRVRAAAAGMGWRVKDVRMTGRSSAAGLSLDDCPSPPPADPSPGVVGAGQGADDNDDDTGREPVGKGVRVVPIGAGGRIIYDPADTIRHHAVSGEAPETRPHAQRS